MGSIHCEFSSTEASYASFSDIIANLYHLRLVTSVRILEVLNFFIVFYNIEHSTME